jgi:hypothetical protein
MTVILSVVLFVLYVALFSFLIIRPRFVKWSGLSKFQLLFIFAVKIVAGIVYGKVMEYYYRVNENNLVDTLRFQQQSLKELELLKRSPGEFFSGMENNYAHGFKGFLSSYNSWWNDIHDTVFIKFLTVINLFTGGRYYVNVIFFAFLFFAATLLLFRIFTDSFPERKTALLIGCFFVPSVLFWTSGIHKDGMVLVGLSLVIANFYQVLRKKKYSIGNLAGMLAGVVILLLIRNFIMVILLPALLVWAVSHFAGRSYVKVYTFSYLVFIVVFFLSGSISEKFDLPKAVANKQHEFLVLKGNSEIPVKNLEPTAKGFLKSFPKAAELVFLQPLPNRITNNFVIPATLEVFLILACVLLFIFFHRSYPLNPFLLFCLFFGLTYQLSIGYTVNIIGAIVRYRSVPFVFLMPPLLASIDWKRIWSLISPRLSTSTNM